MTADPVPVPVGLVGHEGTYDSAADPHEQANARFTREGRSIVHGSDRGGEREPGPVPGGRHALARMA